MRDFTNNNADTKKKTLDSPPDTIRKEERIWSGFGPVLGI